MTLNRIFIGAVAAVFAQSAWATEEGQPRLLGCYQRVLVPAEYKVTKTLIKAPVRKYVKRNDRWELLEYPAVYQEDKELIRGEYYKMQEIVCE